MKRGGTDHPKIKRLARLLSIMQCHAIGIMESLWHFTARHAIQGDIGRWSDEEIAEGIYWDGDTKLLIQALVQSGLINQHSTHRLIVHDWHIHADDSVKKTLKNRCLNFLDFPELSGKVAKSSETFGTFPENSLQVPNVSDQPFLSFPGPILSCAFPVPLKKEGEESPAPPSCSDLAKAQESKPPPPPKRTRKSKIIQDESPIVFKFPVIHRNGDPENWPLHQNLFDKFQDTYLSLDILQECKKARLWTEANNLKTYTGMAKFLTNWLNRAQNGLRGSLGERSKTAYEQRFAEVESAKTLD